MPIKTRMVGTEHILDEAITTEKVAALSITAVKIAAGAIIAAKIAAGAITTDKLDALAVTTEKIAAGAIEAAKIAAGAITADKISVSQLSAIAADLGTIIAGLVTGAIIRTAASGSRVLLDTDKLVAYDADENEIFKVILTGADIGDIVLGDTTRAYLKWDQSVRKLLFNDLVTPGYVTGETPIGTLVYATTGDIDYYIDPDTGGDGNDGSYGSPFETIQHAIDLLPKIIMHNVTIHLAGSLNYSETYIALYSFTGSGQLQILGEGIDAKGVLVSGETYVFVVNGCTCEIWFRKLSTKVTGSSAGGRCFYIQYSPTVHFYKVYTSDENDAGQTNTTGIHAELSRVYTYNCGDYDADKCVYGLRAADGSFIGYNLTTMGDTNKLAESGGLITDAVIDPEP